MLSMSMMIINDEYYVPLHAIKYIMDMKKDNELVVYFADKHIKCKSDEITFSIFPDPESLRPVDKKSKGDKKDSNLLLLSGGHVEKP